MFIPIKAVGKERPRMSYFGSRQIVYTPKKTRDFEAKIALYAMNYMKKHSLEITDKAVSVVINVYSKIPKSWSKKKRLEALTGNLRPMKTPDGDNIIKAILDGLQGIYYENDKQVVQMYYSRLYDDEDRMYVELNVL